MLGKATAEFRKMTSDFRYALEDEVRDLERQTRIREEEAAAAARTAPVPAPSPDPETAPEGAVPRDTPVDTASSFPETPGDATASARTNSVSPETRPAEPLSVPHEKSPDDNTAV